MLLSDLRSHPITEFREDRLKQYSAGTALKDRRFLSAVINTRRTEWGLENVLRTNPLSLISKPKTPRPIVRRLVVDEIERLLSACASLNPWFRPVVLFAIEAGLRRGAVLTPRETQYRTHSDKLNRCSTPVAHVYRS